MDAQRKQDILLFACHAAQPQSESMKILLERIKRNEEIKPGGTLAFAAQAWRRNTENDRIFSGKRRNSSKTKSNFCEDEIAIENLKKRIQGRLVYAAKFRADKCEGQQAGDVIEEKEDCLKIFRMVGKKVILFNRVFSKMRLYAAERGHHQQISSDAMQLKDSVEEGEKDLMFNPNDYKSRYQFSFPKWARSICQLRPEERSPEQVKSIVSLMSQLKDFRKYSKKMQTLLAQIVRYESFGRRRVVIRKGHLGISFYIIFSGSVGVVVDGDEDQAFDKNEKSPVHLMRKGDSFGEIALVQKCRRSATVVCMEYTEFMVIDKQDFFKLGVDKFVEEEVVFRFTFIKSLDFFKTWKDEDLKELARVGRNMEYLCDKVIEENSTNSEFVYIIAKGQADVLRLLDLTVHDNIVSSKKQQSSPIYSRTSSGTGYYSATSTDLLSSSSKPGSPDEKLELPGYNTPVGSQSRTFLSPTSNKSYTSQNSNQRVPLATCPKRKQSSASSLSSGCKTETPELSTTYSYSHSKSQRAAKLRWMALKKKTVYKEKTPRIRACLENQTWRTMLDENSVKGNLGLGAYIRVNTLCAGDVFGMKHIAREENRHSDCARKFVLISSGCEVIRIHKYSVQRAVDEETLEKIPVIEPGYPSDDDLFKVFSRYHDWRSFRENLVDHVTHYQSSIKNAFNERSSKIPTIPRIENREYSRVQSPVEHWNMLVDNGNIKKDITSSWNIASVSLPPTNTKEIVRKIHAAPFIQDRVLTARASQRNLVLTHGGSRVNKFKGIENITMKKPPLISLSQ